MSLYATISSRLLPSTRTRNFAYSLCVLYLSSFESICSTIFWTIFARKRCPDSSGSVKYVRFRSASGSTKASEVPPVVVSSINRVLTTSLIGLVVASPSVVSRRRFCSDSVSADRTEDRKMTFWVMSVRTWKVRASPTDSPNPTKRPLPSAGSDGKTGLPSYLSDAADA